MRHIVVLTLVACGCRGEGSGSGARNDPSSAQRDANGARDESLPVAACPSAACEPFVVASLPFDRGTALALDGAGFAYAGPLYGDAIYRVALAPGSEPEMLYRSPGADIGAIEVRGDILRWSSNAAGTVYEAPLAGGGPIDVVADGLPGVWGFASDDRSLYWTDFAGSAPGMVWKKPLDAGASVGLGRDAGSRMAVSVLIDRASGDILYGDRTARIMRVPAGGGTPTAWVELGGKRESHGLAQDDEHVYVETLASKDVLRIDRRSRRIELFLRAEQTPAAVAVDATTVYWLDYAEPVMLRGKRK